MSSGYGDKAPKKQIFDWSITFGNVLTILIFIVGGIVGYIRLQERVDMMSRELMDHKRYQQSEMREFVRKDVQDTRNSFIDRQLQSMQEKLDKIIQLVD